MVSSQLSGLSRNRVQGTFQNQLLLPSGLPDVPLSDFTEFEFTDVFGPLSVQPALEASSEYDDPAVIYNRSHSLLRPTTCVSPSLNLSKPTLYESEDSKKHDSSDHASESSVLEEQGVRLEDFEVLKVVGQGAFGKVYQVRRSDSSEIYAMKVMRKDKVMEKNHAEYMKSERDILTKVDHPFIVQLRYSFQVILPTKLNNDEDCIYTCINAL